MRARRLRVFVVLLCCSVPVSCGWVMDAGVAVFGDGFFKDDEDRRVRALTEFRPRLKAGDLWSGSSGAKARGSYAKFLPLVQGNVVFVSDAKGSVRAFSAHSGKRQWQRSFKVPVSFGVGGGGRTLMVGTAAGELIAFAADSGKLLWRKRLSSSEITAISRVHHGMVLVRDSGGRVIAASVSDGSRLWAFETELPALTLRGMSVPRLHKGFGFVGLDDGRLLIVALDDGRVHREFRVGLVARGSDLEHIVDIDGQFQIRDGVLYVAAYRGRMLALDVETREILWSVEAGSYAGLDVDDEFVYVVATDGGVRALDRFSGAEAWDNPAFSVRTLSAPLVSGEAIVVGDNLGYLYWLSRTDGTILTRLRVARSPITSAPVAWRNRVIALAVGGDLTAAKITARMVARSG